jgi:hypothetical protein
MNNWRQEIHDIIRARCTHADQTANNCLWCTQTIKKILAAMDEGLDKLIEDADKYHAGLIEEFKRSVLNEF